MAFFDAQPIAYQSLSARTLVCMARLGRGGVHQRGRLK